jgi:hypothetical protein
MARLAAYTALLLAVLVAGLTLLNAYLEAH